MSAAAPGVWEGDSFPARGPSGRASRRRRGRPVHRLDLSPDRALDVRRPAEVGDHVVDGNRLRRRGKPGGRDHRRQALDQEAASGRARCRRRRPWPLRSRSAGAPTPAGSRPCAGDSAGASSAARRRARRGRLPADPLPLRHLGEVRCPAALDVLEVALSAATHRVHEVVGHLHPLPTPAGSRPRARPLEQLVTIGQMAGAGGSRTRQRTFQASARERASRAPMKPVAPVTSAVRLRAIILASRAVPHVNRVRLDAVAPRRSARSSSAPFPRSSTETRRPGRGPVPRRPRTHPV